MAVFLHAADLQIGANRRHPDYLTRYEKMMAEIAQIGKSYSCDFAVFAGDIHHRNDVTVGEHGVFTGGLSLWSDLVGTPTFTISGNHEVMKGNTEVTTLDSLARLTCGGLLRDAVVVDGLPQIDCELTDVNVAMVPFTRHTSSSFRFVVQALLDEIPATRIANPTVVVAHDTFTGACGPSGRSFGGIALPNLPEVTYWALGDIHHRQALKPNAWYPGPTIQHTFDERFDFSGVLIVDTDDPTNPIPIVLETPEPLVTVTEIPEREQDWPEHALIKLRLESRPDPSEIPSWVRVVNHDYKTLAKVELKDDVSEPGNAEFFHNFNTLLVSKTDLTDPERETATEYLTKLLDKHSIHV